LIIGIAPRFWSRSNQSDYIDVEPLKGNRFREALAVMHRARLADGRPFGLLLQQSLQSSLALMMIVGGLVVFFSAALELFVQSGLSSLFHDTTAGLLQLFGLSPKLAPALVKGTFEVTLGAKAAATDSSIPLVDQIAAAAFVLSWAGLSVHAQVAGLMSNTGWRYLPFARARLMHGFIAMLLVYLFWPLLNQGDAAGLPTLAQTIPSFHRTSIPILTWLPLIALSIIVLIVALGTVVIGFGKLRRR
jgi:nucleoside recognition membrane protein YjiH